VKVPFLSVRTGNLWDSYNAVKKTEVGAGKFLGYERFLPEFHQTWPKVFVRLLPTNFHPQKSWRPFRPWPAKKSLHVFLCFSANVGRDFSEFSGILLTFSEILPGLSTNQNFWGCTWTPTSNTTAPLYEAVVLGSTLVATLYWLLSSTVSA